MRIFPLFKIYRTEKGDHESYRGPEAGGAAGRERVERSLSLQEDEV